MLCRTTTCKRGSFESLLTAAIARARQLGLIDRRPEAAVDATGFEARHASRYYVFRSEKGAAQRRSWPKLTAVCHTRSHLIVGAVVTRGPSQDSPQFFPAMYQAGCQLKWDRLLADAGYDSEQNHAFCRVVLGMRSTVIALNPRTSGRRWPLTRYRRQMKRADYRRGYGQRWQIESAFSRHKRLLGSALRNRHDVSQERETLLRVLTHNLMILR